jgi:hypothetical protein
MMNALPFGILFGAFGVVLVLAGLLAAGRFAAALRSRLQTLLEAVQLTQRQLTELRSAQDALGLRVEETAQRLAERIEPRLTGIADALRSAQTADEVHRARAAGRLTEETARTLLAELDRVAEESLAGDSPH